MSIFAILSEVPYDLAFGTSAFDPAQQNVFFTLAGGLLALILVKNHKAAIVPVTAAVALASWYLHFDGSYYGVIMIVLFYFLKDKQIGRSLAVFALQIIILLVYRELPGLNDCFSAFSLVFIYWYNGKRGRNWKYVFYVFYPAHLLIFALITKLAVIPMFQ